MREADALHNAQEPLEVGQDALNRLATCGNRIPALSNSNMPISGVLGCTRISGGSPARRARDSRSCVILNAGDENGRGAGAVSGARAVAFRSWELGYCARNRFGPSVTPMTIRAPAPGMRSPALD